MNKILRAFIGIIAVAVMIVMAYEAMDQHAELIESQAYAATRPVVAAQRSPREIVFQLLDDDGTNNASVAVGDVEINIADSATGSYTITFVDDFFRKPMVFCQDASTDAVRSICEFGTTTSSTAIMRCYSAAAPTTLTNFDILNCRADGWDAAEDW